jgi:hypothetical protein
MLDDDGATVTVATGTGTTETFVEPSTPSMLATMAALPRLTPVTTPDADTSAMAGELLDQKTDRPLSSCPLLPNACAVNVTL